MRRSRYGYPVLSRLAEFVYSVLLRPRPLRALAHRLLLRIVPSRLRIGGFDLFPNPEDPVLSVAVTLGVYEPFELEVFEERCRPGATVVDIGANVGLYTGIAAVRVGPSGLVLAVEPDPESYGYLDRMIRENAFTHVRAVAVAAGDRDGEVDLFPCAENRADARIYEASGTRRKITVPMSRMDSLLAQNGVREVQLVKMDCQGAEGLVWRGFRETLARSPSVVIFTEFWPFGLKRTGVDPEEFLHGIAADGFRAWRIDESSRRILEIRDLRDLLRGWTPSEYPSLERSHANLILEKALP